MDGRRHQQPVYLLGSVHLLRAQDHPLPRVIDDAYDEAETPVMELDMDDLDPLLMQATINRLGMLDEGTSLQDVMGDELYAEAKAGGRARIPLDMLERTEPWLAAITVEQLALYRIGFNPSLRRRDAPDLSKRRATARKSWASSPWNSSSPFSTVSRSTRSATC